MARIKKKFFDVGHRTGFSRFGLVDLSVRRHELNFEFRVCPFSCELCANVYGMCTASTARRHRIFDYKDFSWKKKKKGKKRIFRACVRSPIIPSRRQYVDKMGSAPASGLKSPRKAQNVQTVSTCYNIVVRLLFQQRKTRSDC